MAPDFETWDGYVFFEMMKIQLLFLILFVLAFQEAFSSSRMELEVISMSVGVEAEDQTHLEANHFSPNIFGEVASGQWSISLVVSVTKLFFSKSNDHQVGIKHGLLPGTKMFQSAIYLGLATYCILLIPSYLQTGNLQI